MQQVNCTMKAKKIKESKSIKEINEIKLWEPGTMTDATLEIYTCYNIFLK